tara:strand:+ start:1472 stop:1873 length:402 start_codon:yes stop_codon:yes gene_type:complete
MPTRNKHYDYEGILNAADAIVACPSNDSITSDFLRTDERDTPEYPLYLMFGLPFVIALCKKMPTNLKHAVDDVGNRPSVAGYLNELEYFEIHCDLSELTDDDEKRYVNEVAKATKMHRDDIQAVRNFYVSKNA